MKSIGENWIIEEMARLVIGIKIAVSFESAYITVTGTTYKRGILECYIRKQSYSYHCRIIISKLL